MRTTIALGLVLASAACGGEEPTASPARTSVMQALRLARESPDGVSPGFNLDGWVSTTLDTRTCSKPDFVDPRGAEGVDNQLARLLPLVDLAGQGAVDALVQGAIGEGRLLMMVSIEALEGDRVRARFERGQGVPLLGTDGKLLSGQTLALHESPLLGEAEGTIDASGTITLEPFALQMPIVVFGVLYLLDMPDARMRFTEAEGGELVNGVLGGAVPIEQVIGFAQAATDSSGSDYVGAFGDGIRDSADMERDASTGLCRRMSLAATFDTVPAFRF